MKNHWMLILLMALLASCSENGNKSDAYGNFESKEITVSAEANGKLVNLNLEEGDQLKKGQKVGMIDTTAYWLKKKQLLSQKEAVASKLDNIEAQINVQKQQKENLTVTKKRIQKMLDDGAATGQQMDDIIGKIKVVEKQIQATKTQRDNIYKELETLNTKLEEVQKNINDCFIINPVKGTVLTKYTHENEFTAMGKPVYNIADLSSMELRVYVSGGQLHKVKLRQEVDVLIDKGKEDYKTMPGTVSWIADEAEFTPKIIQTKEERVNLVYAVKIRVKNDGSIKIGMPGEIRIKN
ncbi:MAG: HlyD family efflux transporter periplasmic adaptor subunit [Bacteroidales bacterium]|nr:HlyD family efflux transporter periplasmic adaptor subunit [Bacteroidales bacterium]